jgi:gas vesicle protein
MEGSAETSRIERDLEHTRARLDATLDALQQKLSPGQMVDEAMTWFKSGSGAEFGRNLGGNVRDNPLPIALIGVGVAWLMVSASRRDQGPDWDEDDDYRGSRRYGVRSSPSYGAGSTYGTGAYAGPGQSIGPQQPMPYEAAAYDDLATKANEAGYRVERSTSESDDDYHGRVYAAKGAVLGVTQQVGETLSTFRDRVEAAVESAADRFRRMKNDMTAAASSAGGRAGDMAGDAARQGRAGLRSLYGYGQSAAYGARDSAGYAADRARDMSSRTADYLKDQPLLMGVLGVAVGAALAMLVPPTRYEREIAGDLRRTLGDQAREAASEVSQKAARVAEAVLDTAHEAAQREGLTGMSPSQIASDARDKVADTAGKVRTVVEESAAAGRDALKREASSSTDGDRTGDRGDRRPIA